MKKNIDCLFIGHNEMDFEGYERSISKMGYNSGAYRDLNLNFVWYKNKPRPVSEIFNLFYFNNRDAHSRGSITPLRMGETFSAAISYLGSYLHRRGFSFDFVNAFHYEKEELAEKLTNNNVLSVAIITTYYVFALPILEIVEFVRKYNNEAKIILGGPFIFSQYRTQAPAVYECLFESINADFYIISHQGEATLVKLLHAIKNNLTYEQIENIYYKRGKEYRSTQMIREDNQLSAERVNWSLFYGKVGEYVDVRTVISCPFSCAFCGSPEHSGKYQTLNAREIESELNQLVEIESLKGLSFIDDTFNVPAQRFKNILRMMKKNKYQFEWISNLRCQFADREMVELMKECGCQGVFLGIESGNDRILENMNKAASVEKYLKGVSLLKEYGILTFGSFIIGFPGETYDTVQDTICFIEESGLDFFRPHLFYFEPITPIWKKRAEYGLKGESFEWSHRTMDSKTAADLIDKIFLSVKNTIWVPQYNFDFDHLWRLRHRGMSQEQIKEFLKAFNSAIKEKLLDPSQEEMFPEAIQRIKKACQGTGETENSPDEYLPLAESYEVKFNF
jgi:radical SAM PhpK family P-methyltransferase